MFSNIPPDLTLPPGGSMIPGSGTVYIGSQQLPPDLTGYGAEAGVVFWSNAAGLSSGIDYWYIAQFAVLPDQPDLFQCGYKVSGGGVKALWGGWIDGAGHENATFEAEYQTTLTSRSQNTWVTAPNGDVHVQAHNAWLEALTSDAHLRADNGNTFVESLLAQIIIKSANGLFLESTYPGPAAIQLITAQGTVMVGGAAAGVGPNLTVSGWAGSGTAVEIKANNTTQDRWQTSTTLQTFGGVANTAVTFDWRWTPDYILDLRFRVKSPGPAFSVGLVATVTAPAALPTLDDPPGTGIFTGAGMGNGGAYNGGLINFVARLNSNKTLDLFLSGASGVSDITGGIVTSTPKV